MKKVVAILLSALLILACTACAEQTAAPTQPGNSATEFITNNIQLSIDDEDGTYASVNAYLVDEGNACVEFTSEINETLTYGLSALDSIHSKIRLTMNGTDGNYISFVTYGIGEGNACVEIVGKVKKTTVFELSVFGDIAGQIISTVQNINWPW